MRVRLDWVGGAEQQARGFLLTTRMQCTRNCADVPSFILLAVQGEKVVCYCYKYNEAKDSVEVSKTEFSKGE